MLAKKAKDFKITKDEFMMMLKLCDEREREDGL